MSLTAASTSATETLNGLTSDPEVAFRFREVQHENRMEGKFTVNKFKGFSHENPEKFIQDFESFAIFKQLQGDDEGRKIIAFYLHLDRPARTWFCSLANEQKDTCEHLHAALKERYVAINEYNQPALIAEGELFYNLKLTPGQALEEYHSIVIEKVHGYKSQRENNC